MKEQLLKLRSELSNNITALKNETHSTLSAIEKMSRISSVSKEYSNLLIQSFMEAIHIQDLKQSYNCMDELNNIILFQEANEDTEKNIYAYVRNIYQIFSNCTHEYESIRLCGAVLEDSVAQIKISNPNSKNLNEYIARLFEIIEWDFDCNLSPYWNNEELVKEVPRTSYLSNLSKPLLEIFSSKESSAEAMLDTIQENLNSRKYNNLSKYKDKEQLRAKVDKIVFQIKIKNPEKFPEFVIEELAKSINKDKIESFLKSASILEQKAEEQIRKVREDAHFQLIDLLLQENPQLKSKENILSMSNFYHLSYSIAKQLSGKEAIRIFQEIGNTNSDFAYELNSRFFAFDDVVLLDDRSIQKILRETENTNLAIALKGVSDEVKEKFFKNMSEQASHLLKEDMDFIGPVRLKDVETAQQKIIDMIIQLEEMGELVVARSSGDELVV